MISTTDSCRQLVAGNYDVIINEPSAVETVLTDFLNRCEHYENELIIQQQLVEQQQQQHPKQPQQQEQQDATNGDQSQSLQPVTSNDSNNDNSQNLVAAADVVATTTAVISATATNTISGYINEFKMLKELSRILKKDTSTYLDGMEHYNRSKNRYGDIIPFNHTRVILSCNPHQHQNHFQLSSHYKRLLLQETLGDSYEQQQELQQPPELSCSQMGCDYINANYIRGPSGSPRAYIASQGPLPGTLNDFWRMIWECNVSVIVMACNEHELGRSKCELYWPEQLEASQTYGNIQVTLMRVRQVNTDFLIRKFSVKYLADEPELEPGQQRKTNDNNDTATATSDCSHATTTRCLDNNSTASSESMSASDESMATSSTATTFTNNITPGTNHGTAYSATTSSTAQASHRRVLMEKSVVQFHISTWPDHGVPDTVQPILELVRLVREVQPFEHTPILVHCSAGCGRTGTICCIDYVYGLMRMGKLDASFDLFSIISEMRQQRMAMVQTLEQYILCHRAVASLFMQQLQLVGHNNHYQHHQHQDHIEPQRRDVCDAKLALATGARTNSGSTELAAAVTNGNSRTHLESPGNHLDTSNETSEDSYKLYHHDLQQRQHETSSSTDEQQTNSDFLDEEDEGEEEEEEDLGPVFI